MQNSNAVSAIFACLGHSAGKRLLAHQLVERFPEEMADVKPQIRSNGAIGSKRLVSVTRRPSDISARAYWRTIFFNIFPFDEERFNYSLMLKSNDSIGASVPSQ